MYCIHYNTCCNSNESLCDDNNCSINYKKVVDNKGKPIKIVYKNREGKTVYGTVYIRKYI